MCMSVVDAGLCMSVVVVGLCLCVGLWLIQVRVCVYVYYRHGVVLVFSATIKTWTYIL